MYKNHLNARPKATPAAVGIFIYGKLLTLLINYGMEKLAA